MTGLKCAIAVLLMAGPVAAHAIDPKAALGALGFPGDTRTRSRAVGSWESRPRRGPTAAAGWRRD